MTGGVDTETDAELRQRFKDTLLRNIAGTADFYEALCQQNTAVSRVVAYGPLKLYQTQITVQNNPQNLQFSPLAGGGSDVKYAWPGLASCFSDLGQTTETFYSPVYDFSFTGGASPTFAPVSNGALATNQIVDLEFQYTTRCSRNDPQNSITNKVDIFIDGVSPLAVTEQTVVTGDQLWTTSSSGANPMLYTGNFVRVGSPGSPTAGNRFMRLGSVPLVSFPPTLTINGQIYYQASASGNNIVGDYAVLQSVLPSVSPTQQNLLTGSHLEISGIEWLNTNIATNTPITVSYVYNQVPQLLNAVISSAKQITTDVMVHQADFLYYCPLLSIEYTRSYSISVVNGKISTRLQQYFAALPFGSQIKLSNVALAVQQTLGVADVIITGIEVYADSSGTSLLATEVNDFKLADNQLAIFQGVTITRVATP